MDVNIPLTTDRADRSEDTFMSFSNPFRMRR